MAMIVKNNMGAQRTLNTLNKNSKKLEKAFSKVASGMKIVGAGDGASEYAISEKMREQIRSLDQDSQNVQNGSSLFKIAAGGIENIVEELRTLKELAIKSANDTNNDGDRLTIQKEFTQRMATINDIATETDYNTKKLLDGRYGKFKIIESGDKIAEILCPDITKSFTALGNTTTGSGGMNGAFTHKIDRSFDSDNYADPIQVAVDFSNYASDVMSFHNKGFSIFCGGCDQYLNVIFDNSISTSESTYNAEVESSISRNAREYRIGIAGISSVDELPKAIFEGIKNAKRIRSTDARAQNNTADSVSVDSNHDLRINRDANDPTKYYFSKESPAIQLFDGIVLNERIEKNAWNNLLKIHHGTQANQAINFYINDMHTRSLGTDDLFDNTKLLGDEGYFKNQSDEKRYYALSYDDDLQAAWLKTLELAQNKTLDDLDVITKQNANIAIRVIDGAIEYALNEATRIGAYLQRLEYTGANITTMNENVQSAESTIRDADMAKEMTEYTKYNVLQQASQSMLAQANQSASSVLSLLQ